MPESYPIMVPAPIGPAAPVVIPSFVPGARYALELTEAEHMVEVEFLYKDRRGYVFRDLTDGEPVLVTRGDFTRQLVLALDTNHRPI